MWKIVMWSYFWTFLLHEEKSMVNAAFVCAIFSVGIVRVLWEIWSHFACVLVKNYKRLSETFTRTYRNSSPPLEERYIVLAKIHHYSILCLLPLQKIQYLSSATVSLVSLPCATANLHTIPKAFTLTHPNKDKFKYATHPRYTLTRY